MFRDPDWFFWSYENCFYQGKLAKEATEIYMKSKAIKIPEDKLVEYIIHQPTGKFGTAELVDIDSPYAGPGKVFRQPVFDLEVPRKLAPYDKSGGKVLISIIKIHKFGSSRHHMTKEKAEDFFNNDENFAI
jgi:hypothetical protein